MHYIFTQLLNNGILTMTKQQKIFCRSILATCLLDIPKDTQTQQEKELALQKAQEKRERKLKKRINNYNRNRNKN